MGDNQQSPTKHTDMQLMHTKHTQIWKKLPCFSGANVKLHRIIFISAKVSVVNTGGDQEIGHSVRHCRLSGSCRCSSSSSSQYV